MQIKQAFIVLCIGLAGCATAPPGDNQCTNLISGVGGLLKFCQVDNQVSVTESGLVGPVAKRDLTIVDDPEVLSSLTRDIGLRPDFKASRKLIAHACVLNGDAYATVRVSDLRRIIHGIHQPRAPDPL